MITLMKASAGSGKTYALAHKYIKMLLADENAYRHILAVTFTNKATDEMKSRILEELSKMNTPKAEAILSNILHDYSAFSVSTIDRFFQQTLRSFARELGQFNRYDVELDKQALVDETVDTILDELRSDNPDDKALIDFIVENLEDNLEKGAALNIESALKQMAFQLKSETFSRKCAGMGFNPAEVYDHDSLILIKKTCREVIRDFDKNVRDAACLVGSAMKVAGLSENDFSRNWIGSVLKYSEWPEKPEKSPSPSLAGKISDPSPDKWFKKADAWRFEQAYSALAQPLEKFLSLWAEHYKVYKTAQMLLSQVYGLGIAARLFAAFERICSEKNVVCLDESNSLLRDIIDGSDAPFVYEKTGVRYSTFLLDEFQDTSLNQWDNFLPLLRESESRKDPSAADDTFDNLIVGDVKQSIYRWRESDWSLLDKRVEQEFHGSVRHRPLGFNWRSLSEIIDFNNTLFPDLAAMLDNLVPAPSGMHTISEIYSGCTQLPGNAPAQQGGSVNVEFVADDDAQIAAVLDCVRRVHDDQHAGWGDIAILVRKKAPGTTIAQALIDNGIPVVTDASLRLKNSISVRHLVSMMSCVDNPNDAIGTFVASRYGLDVGQMTYHSLPDLVDSLYKILCQKEDCLKDARSEVMYIMSFMDIVMSYSISNGNGLRSFLQWWKQQDPSVNTADSADAVRIITIHKSKGLAFPYVIVPFLEKISLYSSTQTSVWASPSADGTALESVSDRLYYVPLNSGAADTCFKGEYELERFNQAVDAINMLYVALTRARVGMTLVSLDKSSGASAGSLLKSWCNDSRLCIGTPYDFASDRGANLGAPSQDIPLSYPYFNIGDRLRIRPYAAEFFTHQDKTFKGLTFREKGIVLHDILSRVDSVEDLPDSIAVAVSDGSLAADGAGAVESMLCARINSRPEFFPRPCDLCRIIRERDIICSDGSECRPDRVILRPDGNVLVVDYKFADANTSKEGEYMAQISRYRQVYLQMGYPKVDACLWYVYSNKVENLKNF